MSLITRWCNGETVTFGGSHYSADGPDADATGAGLDRRLEPAGAVTGATPAGSPGLAPSYAEAGATWRLESLFGLRGSHEALLERVIAGPPQ